VFKGRRYSVAEMLATPSADRTPVLVGRVHDVAGNARHVADLVAAGDSLGNCWRFGVLQTLDDYTSTLRRGGPGLAATVFDDEPPRTGSPEIDAAFAALAEFLADRDGWPVPAWALDGDRRVESWYPEVPWFDRAEAEESSPAPFRARGIYITTRSLARA